MSFQEKKPPLPKSWLEVPLGEVAEISSGYGFPKKYQGKKSGDLPFFKVKDISRAFATHNIVLRQADNYISFDDCNDLRAQPLKEGSIVFAKIGAAIALNRRAILGQSSLVDNNVIGIYPFPQVLNNLFTFYFFLSIKLEEYSRATVVPSVRKSDVEQIKIPIPPFSEQNRIVSEIEEIFTKLYAGIESLRTVKAQLQRYRQAVLKHTFEGKLTEDWRQVHKNMIEPIKVFVRRTMGEKKAQRLNLVSKSESPGLPESWAYGKLEDWVFIAGRIGWRGLKASEYVDDGPLLLSVHNLNIGKGITIDTSEGHHLTLQRYQESPEIQLMNNDILLVKDGAGIGKIGIIDELNKKATVNSSLLVVRGKELFEPKFLLYFLMGPKMQEVVKTRITGSATPHLFQRDIKKFELWIPPLEEQREIVDEVESHFSVADEIQDVIEKSLLQSEKLRARIIKTAIEGRLVPQNPKDEPAEKLLKRIRDGKAKCNDKKKKIKSQENKHEQMGLSYYVE